MTKRPDLHLIIFFTLLTVVLTAVVVFAWEQSVRDPFFRLVERNYPGDANRQARLDWQQRVEHFTISITVDLVVVTLLLRVVRRQQRRLAESEKLYRALFENALTGVGVVTEIGHRLIDANAIFCRILGRPTDEVVGRRVGEVIRPSGDGAPDEIVKLLGGGDSGKAEINIRGAGGAPLPVAVSFKTFVSENRRLIILIMRDTSARKRLEAERGEMQQRLIQTSQLASVGELSAGVAHEINNPLNGIINFAQLLKDEGAGRNAFEMQMIDGIIDEGGRIANIVRGLLIFARSDTPQRGRVRLDEAVKTSLTLFGRQFQKDGIVVEIDLPEEVPPVRGDGTRLRQVVLNMISNAHHSLRESRAGVGGPEKLFRIAARRGARDGRPTVIIEFYDNGIGIRREDVGKVFDPFFTTRRDAGGTGLGLSISFGIIRDHGGTIRVESEEGQFARFVVELPAAGEEENGAV